MALAQITVILAAFILHSEGAPVAGDVEHTRSTVDSVVGTSSWAGYFSSMIVLGAMLVGIIFSALMYRQICGATQVHRAIRNERDLVPRETSWEEDQEDQVELARKFEEEIRYHQANPVFRSKHGEILL
eukprot:Colp12_sorted_trinity150504_noHs@4490